jgi:hypothetical protein
MSRSGRASCCIKLICALVMILSGCYLFNGYHPRDTELEGFFLEHKQLFDLLIKMANEDRSVTRIANDFFKLDSNNSEPIRVPTPAFSRYRWNQYCDTFRELNLKNGLMRLSEYPGTVFLLPFYNELTLVDDKGYAFSPRPLVPLQNSLDDPRRLNPGFAFKHIQGDWYLFAIGKP